MTFIETLHTHLQAIQQRDIDTFLATLTTEEALSVILPNGTLFETRTGFVEFTRDWFADPDWQITVDLLRTVETTDMGLALLAVTYDDRDPNGQPYQLQYYLSLVFVQQQGAWRLVHDQNTLLPTSKK